MNKQGIIKLPKLPELFQDFNIVMVTNTKFYVCNYGSGTTFTKSSILDLIIDIAHGDSIVVPKETGLKLRALRKSDLNLAMVLIEGLKITYKNKTEELHSKLKEMYERAI